MLARERRQSILSLIKENGSARTVDLARIFNVSDQTIRRDLFELEEKGLIAKSHGGGVLVSWEGASYPERAVVRQLEKQLIAKAALTHIRRDTTVAIGPGTTTEALAQLLNGLGVHVVTSSLAVARAIHGRESSVRLTGGLYRPGSELVVGDWAEASLEGLFADVSFIGISGIGADAGYTVTQEDEARVLRQFIRVAKRAIILTDSSKFHRVAKATVAPLEAAHVLITDADAPSEQVALLKDKGVEVLVVDTAEAG